MKLTRTLRLQGRDAAELESIQLQIEKMVSRSKAIFERLKREDEERYQAAFDDFLGPLECAMVGADYVVKAIRETVEDMKHRPKP